VEEITMIMNQYELIYVTRPTLNAEELSNLSTKVSGLIEKAKGQVLATEEWGRRRLAYPILKNEHGLYTYINFVAPADAPIGVEKSMGLDDSFMRYMTVRLGENVDVAGVRELAEARKAERDAARAAEEEAARAAAEEEAARAAEAAEMAAKAAAFETAQAEFQVGENAAAEDVKAEAAPPAAAEEPAAEEAAAEEAAAEEAAAEEPAAEEPAAEEAAPAEKAESADSETE
jgi:ribosomal protein S6